MTKVDEARAALQGKDVAERAAAARVLASHGVWSDIDGLLAIAMGDKSPSLRIYTAAAATRIVLRTRMAGELGSAEERAVLEALRRYNPQGNPTILMVLGALGTSTARSRLGRLLRDPHSDVRLAAAAAVRRAALSQAAHGDADLPRDVEVWLGSRKTPPDTRAELVRLAGEAGWAELAGALRSAVAEGGGVAEAAQEGLKRLAERERPEAWHGLWIQAGADVLDEEEPGEQAAWLLVADGVVHDGSDARAVEPRGGALDIAGLGTARRLWAPQVKAEGVFPAIQLPSATYWRCEGKALAKVVEERIRELGAHPVGCRWLAEQLAEVDGAVAPRARALALWKGGDAAAASEAFDRLLGVKKPKADLYWWRANMALGEGALDDARSYVDDYLAKAPKKAAYRGEAEALKASLTR